VSIGVDEVDVQPEIAPRSKPWSKTTDPEPSDRTAPIAVLSIALLATLGLLPWLGKSMFADEGATVYSAHLSWSNLWAQSRHVDLVMLPYYVVVHFWVMVSGNIAFIRALSLLTYFGTIVVVGHIAIRLAGRWCGIIAAFLTATSALLILKSLNARPYEFSALFVVLSAAALFRWLEVPHRRWAWAFSVFAVLATAMQLFSLLAPFAMLASVMVVRPALITQRLRSLAAPVAVLAVTSLAWIAASIGEVGQVNWIATGGTESRLLAEARGPAIGQLYDLVLLVFVVLVIAILAIMWDRDVRAAFVDRVSRDRDALALMVGWAVLPTVVLSIASFSHPIYANRYVTASAPGAALLIAFICVRLLPLVRERDPLRYRTREGVLRRRVTASIGAVAAFVLFLGYVNSASTLQEDVQGEAHYVVQNLRYGDVLALPDHALTAATEYYLVRDHRHVPLWPQLGIRQRFVEGLDLKRHPYSARHLPARVWLLNDGSVAKIHAFQSSLAHSGYVLIQDEELTGVSLLLYSRSTTNAP
jgi:4-amino-4-deoxy-L-arabinose transferase-like glycosyltransferase